MQGLKSIFRKGPYQCPEPTTSDHIAIEWGNDNPAPLYYYPRLLQNQRLFNPNQWSKECFSIGRHLGRGKFGHVYLAKEKRTGHIVALKVLSKKQMLIDDVVGQLRRELEIHSRMDHPNVLKMYGFFFDERRIYIVLEYAPKGQLYCLFKKVGKFSEKETAHIVKQVVMATTYLHSMDVIHRDIKPQNILLGEDLQVKVSDFGWSVHSSGRRKTYCGTADYICPEIVNHLSYDSHLDIWTIGVLAFQLAYGSPPFQTQDRKETSRRIKNVQFTIPTSFSLNLAHFVSRILVKNPYERLTLEEALEHPFLLTTYSNC